jgi:hypothetical protein
MHMESAHSTVESTVGVLKDFPVQIGPLTFYIQVQVAENLPCEVLMGRPFFRLASAVTYDFTDGTQDIVLRCPNTNKEIKVPTYERSRKKTAPPQDSEDF